ncbi:hypothetical protein TrLO_g3505 [Triparma laevis f. longispina]|uniref:Uncharacterized protein n=1 Tax=Triparma laevis f. longispina TaxID=1714387 RepID=A0A9W7F9Y6_9STRA|nr:hypothetical protein TrLO_g3505 [Triparma laevis f. longispina]
MSSDAKCCAGSHIGYMCPCDCGCCIYTPVCSHLFVPSFIIGMFICTCKDSQNPGAYQNTDNKGNFLAFVPLDEEAKVLAHYSENVHMNPKRDAMEVSCFCEK